MLCCNWLVELSLSKPEFPLAYFSALSLGTVHLKSQVKFFFFQGHWLIGVNKVPYLTQLLESWQLRLLCKYHNWLAIVFAKVYFEWHSNSLFPFIFPFFWQLYRISWQIPWRRSELQICMELYCGDKQLFTSGMHIFLGRL